MDKKIDPQGFEAFDVKAFKLTPEDVAGLYNEAGELTDFSLLEKKDSERVTKLSSDSKNQYSRGLKEAALKLEKELKEKYEVDSDLIGVELIDHIIDSRIEEVKTSGTEDIQKHPEVIKLINQHGKEKKALEKEWMAKLEAKEREVNEANLFKEIETIGLAEIDNLNPILPEDARKAKKIKDIFAAEMRKYKYQRDGESPVVLKADGTALLDDHGHPVTFADHMRNIASEYVDFRKAEERSSSGNSNQGTGGTKKVRAPKDKDDYVNLMKDQTLTSVERVEIMKLAKAANIV